MRPDLYFKGSPVRAEADKEPQYRRLLEWRDHRTTGGGVGGVGGGGVEVVAVRLK